MATTSQPEVWLRGPLQGISPQLQPVGHALLQACEEISAFMQDFPSALLWERPGTMASPGFHLQHLCGVLDRLFTYADGNMLSEEQLDALRKEGNADEESRSAEELVEAFRQQVHRSVNKLKTITDHTLTEKRGVGRAQLPSTVLGLLFHAAEHTMRHTGQLLVTVKWLKANAHQPGL